MPSARERIQELLHEYQEAIPEPDPDYPLKIRKTCNCIHNHLFDQRLTVCWLKKQCHLNSNNFSGKFKYYIGNSPKSYWLEHRVAASRKILKEQTLEDTSILTIALTLGFRSHSAFSMTFKKYEGISPSDFRNKMLG